MDQKSLTVRISEELHHKLKIQLAKDKLTFQKWAADNIEQYVENNQEG